jgi:glycosyltransferase involved in cell wall biosynthesis
MLVAIQTHPIQYHAPVFRAIQQRWNVPVTAIYGSDFSLAGYRDTEFNTTFAWDTDLVSGYESVFLARSAEGGAGRVEDVRATGLGAALARLRPSAVLVGGYSPHFHRAAFFHAWRARIPILFRAETTDLDNGSPIVNRAVRKAGLRPLYRRAARLLYIGARSKRHYEEVGCDPTQLVFSPYCVDTSPFELDEAARSAARERLRTELGAGAAHRVILFSGKLTPKKRPDLLLEALRQLSHHDRPSAVVFLGDGELRARLEAECRTLSGVRVHFTGFQNQRMLSPYYHAADLLVLPSQHSETWGLVVNEALAHGVPCVVSSAVGCAEDLVIPGQTGEVFEVGSAAGLASAIARADALVGRSEVREACRACVSGYSVDRAACGIVQAYRSVVAA